MVLGGPNIWRNMPVEFCSVESCFTKRGSGLSLFRYPVDEIRYVQAYLSIYLNYVIVNTNTNFALCLKMIRYFRKYNIVFTYLQVLFIIMIALITSKIMII